MLSGHKQDEKERERQSLPGPVQMGVLEAARMQGFDPWNREPLLERCPQLPLYHSVAPHYAHCFGDG